MSASNFVIGLQYVVDGFKLIIKPGVKRFVFIPLLINIILFSALLYFTQHLFGSFTHWVQQHVPHWLQWLSSLLWIFFFISFFLVMIYTFVTLANLICAPFNSFLSEKIEFYLRGVKREQSMKDALKDIPRIIKRQLAIIAYFIPRALLILILFFIPILQLFAAPIWFLFNAWFMTLQYIDYPTDNNRIPLQTVKTQLSEQQLITLGFGCGILFLSMIPIVNFFVIPAAVAGATKLWIERFRD